MITPEKDTHFRNLADYQEKIREKALRYVSKHDLAVDIGAHVGFFTKRFCQLFKTVVAFEPKKENRECLRKNVEKAIIMPFALGKEKKECGMRNPAPFNSGAWELCEGKGVFVVPLDYFRLKPDLIKIDVQGSTMDVIKGAVETLKSRPVLIIEVFKDGVRDEETIDFLKGLGASIMWNIKKDIVMAWRD